MNFSSNICSHADLTGLKNHLASQLDLIKSYPEPEAWSLESMIASKLGIPAECVIVTSGATDAIYLVAQSFPFEFIVLGPTFSEYEDACNIYYREPDLTSIWVCNPNNPNGRIYMKEELRMFARNYNLLVIDQSYEHYTNQPMLTAKECLRMKNVIQIHSMTKTYGIPGLRLGFITTNVSFAGVIRQQMRPWSVNALAIEAGKFLMQRSKPCVPDLQEAQRLYKQLRTIESIKVERTQTNFMLCYIKGHTAAELKDYLIREHGMLIRDASNFRNLTPHHFRVASQTPEENEALVAAIRQFVTSV
jgi:threonine-phosphate decarboxylase